MTGTDRNLNAQWWRDEYEAKRYQHVLEVERVLYNSLSSEREDMYRHARLYSTRAMRGMGVQGSVARSSTAVQARLSLNVVKSCVDAYVAKMAKDRPKVSFETQGADWTTQEKAKDLTSFMEGQFYETELYQTAPAIVRDSAVFNIGYVEIRSDGDEGDEKVVIERTLPWEISVDEAEARYGKPRQMFRRKTMDREVAKALWPDYADEIQRANRYTSDDSFTYDAQTDCILIVEAWHLKSSPSSEDGRHVIAVEGATLLDESYERAYFPFVPLRRSRPLVGWYGIGLAEELLGIQFEINTLLRKIQQAHLLLGVTHWFVPNGSGINNSTITNEMGQIIRFSGAMPPIRDAGPALSQEIYTHLWQLVQKAYEITGISQLSAQSQKPAGLDSGEALRVYASIETERFLESGQIYQDWYLEIAKHVIDLVREISERSKGYTVKANAVGPSNLMRTIDWKDVNLQEDEYALKMFPTNALAGEPAARIARVTEMINGGFIDKDQARRLIDFPDIREAMSIQDASYELVETIISKMLREGRYIGPEPYMHLSNPDGSPGEAFKQVQLAYLKAKRDDVSEKRLQLFRDWLQAAADIVTPPPPPAPPSPPPGPPGPPGPPSPPAPGQRPASPTIQ